MISNTEQCLHQLVFALKLKGCIEANIIPKSLIDVEFELKASAMRFEADSWESQETMILLAENAINLAIGGLAIAADEELDKSLGRKDPFRREYPFNLRAVIYQIRNCFAHSFQHPTYKVSPKYCNVYSLDFLPTQLIIDFKTIDKMPFSYDHFRGIENFWGIFQEASQLISRTLCVNAE